MDNIKDPPISKGTKARGFISGPEAHSKLSTNYRDTGGVPVSR